MKVVFVGGAQAQRLDLIYARQFGDGREACVDPDRAKGANLDALREADKVVWIDARGGDEGTPALRGEVIRLPELQLDFLWPFGGQPHVANMFDPWFAEGPFPAELGDAWLNRALEGRRLPEAAEADYLALDVARVVDLDRMRALALERQRELDARFGVDFAARIEAGFRAGPLFSSPRTPGQQMFGALVEAAWARLGLPLAEWEETPAPGRELPIHPSVAAHFGLDWARGRVSSPGWGEPVDFAEYVRRYLAYAEGPELEQGLACQAAGDFGGAARRLEIAAARPMGRRTRAARRGLARASLAALGADFEGAAWSEADLDDTDVVAALVATSRGRWGEAEAGLLGWLARTPGRAETFALLATIRERRGDAEGRLAALELAAGLAPDAPGLLRRLTAARADQGDLWGAIRTAQAEIALAPGDPHPRARAADLYARVGHVGRARQETQRALAAAQDDDLRAELTRRLQAMAAA